MIATGRVGIVLFMCLALGWSSTHGTTPGELDAWMEPAPVLGRPSKVTVRAVDRETRTPVRGTVTIYGARDTTRVPTNEPFIHVFRCDRRRRGASRTSSARLTRASTITMCERITVTAPGYAPVAVSYAGSVHPSSPSESELSAMTHSVTRGTQ